jgi:hypothetical protein
MTMDLFIGLSVGFFLGIFFIGWAVVEKVKTHDFIRGKWILRTNIQGAHETEECEEFFHETYKDYLNKQ